MKRHEALHSLSHHHHYALVMSLRLKKAEMKEKNGESTSELIEALREFWPGSQEHFQEEETILLPAYAQYGEVDRPEIIEMLLEHVRIRAAVNSIIRQISIEPEDFHQLGVLLEKHIRKEERIIFPLIEEALPEERLMELAPYFHDHYTSKDR
jgi:hemerythrin-like domain-containing protein